MRRKKQLYYGWYMVMVAALGYFFSGAGQTYSNSTFIDYLIEDFNWSRTEVSGIYSIATFTAGIIMILVGRFVDKFGQRLMMISVGTLLAVTLFYNGMIQSLPMLFFGFLFLRLLGQGSMTLVPTTLVTQWFIKKRGVAFSLMSLGGFISSATFPIINTYLIEEYNWQFAWRFWGILILVIFVPISLIFVRNRPEDMGMVPDGPIKPFKLGETPPLEINEVDWTLAEAMKTRVFWMILFCIGVPAMINTGITFHLFSIFQENGLAPQMAAVVLSMMALVGMPISFMSGFIFDRIESHVALMMVFIVEIIAFGLLFFVNTPVMAILFGFMWGLAGGLERISLKAIWPNYFGRRYIGAINGVSSAAMVVSSSLGPLPFGLGYDLVGNYSTVLSFMMGFPIIAFIFSLFLRKPEKK